MLLLWLPGDSHIMRPGRQRDSLLPRDDVGAWNCTATNWHCRLQDDEEIAAAAAAGDQPAARAGFLASLVRNLGVSVAGTSALTVRG